MPVDMLTPMLALIVWTFVIWLWMYATRIPAMRAARIAPKHAKRSADLATLPVSVQQVADNYNHLHEQPTIFYALMVYTHLAGAADPTYAALAWIYVGLRVAHSLIQCTANHVLSRFIVFVLASVVLMTIAGRNVIDLFGAH
jgi:hypothetical protein